MSQQPDTHTNKKAGSVKASSKYVHVYNATRGIIACHVNRAPGETTGPASRRIKFMPGNNRMLRTELDICEANHTFMRYMKAMEAETPEGHKYQLTRLTRGKKVDHSEEEKEILSKIAEERAQYS